MKASITHEEGKEGKYIAIEFIGDDVPARFGSIRMRASAIQYPRKNSTYMSNSGIERVCMVEDHDAMEKFVQEICRRINMVD